MSSITQTQIYEKLKLVEHEISKMKIALLKREMGRGTTKKPISLEGIWKGVEITKEDIKASQKSLFPQNYDL